MWGGWTQTPEGQPHRWGALGQGQPPSQGLGQEGGVHAPPPSVPQRAPCVHADPSSYHGQDPGWASSCQAGKGAFPGIDPRRSSCCPPIPTATQCSQGPEQFTFLCRRDPWTLHLKQMVCKTLGLESLLSHCPPSITRGSASSGGSGHQGTGAHIRPDQDGEGLPPPPWAHRFGPCKRLQAIIRTTPTQLPHWGKGRGSGLGRSEEPLNP